MAQFHYKKLGLVNTREMFQKAMAGGYAVPAYNFNNLLAGQKGHDTALKTGVTP
jgi:fructose/tagatose bisphosphate aldolase